MFLGSIFAKLLAAGFEPRSRGSKSKFEWIFLGSTLQNCRWRGSSPGRGVRSPSVNRCFLARFCKIVGGGVRTQVAGFEVQVLIDVSWVDFAKLLAAGFEPRSRGSKSNFKSICLGSILPNCRRRGSNLGRGVRSPCFDRCFLGRFCKIVGGGVRTQVAGFEVQV